MSGHISARSKDKDKPAETTQESSKQDKSSVASSPDIMDGSFAKLIQWVKEMFMAESVDHADCSSGKSEQVSRQAVRNHRTHPSKSSTIDPSFITPEPYNMQFEKAGKLLIINNRNFMPKTRMLKREGSDKDAQEVFGVFKKLRFDVTIKADQTTTEMLGLMDKYAMDTYVDAGCFACIILTHGEPGGQLYGTDGIITLELLMEPFKKTKTLVGKPKLFFIQACRGVKFDEGVEVTDSSGDGDAVKPVVRIPTESDFLVVQSTCEGYFSWRNKSNGTWFVQTLCKVLKEYGATKEIMWILTLVNQIVAVDYQSCTGDANTNNKKQSPCIISTMRKQLYLTASLS